MIRALLVLGVIAVAAPAAAQPRFDPQFFHPAPLQRSNGLGVYQADVLRDGAFEVGLMGHYDHSPLVVRDYDDERLYAIVGHQASLHVMGGLGLFDRLEIAADIPILLSQGGDVIPSIPNFDLGAPTAGAGIGDIRLMAKVQLFTTGSETNPAGAAMALVLEGIFPTGEDRNYQGEDWRVAPRLILDAITSDRHRISLMLGYTYRQQADIQYLSVGPTFDWGFAVRFTTQYVHVVPEIRGSIVTTPRDFTPPTVPGGMPAPSRSALGFEEVPMEAALSFRVLPIEQLQIQAAGSAGLFQGFGAPDFRIVLGASWLQTPSQDRDGDGIPNPVDECPDVPEDIDTFEDENGCPDPDNDQDGVLDDPDECPMEPEDVDQFEDENGCPDPDNDQDRVLDDPDECPNDAEDRDGFEDENGCPDPDNDQDGILDTPDHCPSAAEDVDGWQDEDGCPDPDNDGDHILDPVDHCPREPEDMNGVNDTDGCPEIDTDHDGLLDPVDSCPEQPEDIDHFEDENGCPDPDNDGDGILDPVDRCVMEPESVNGFEDTDGCPDQPLIEVTCRAIVIHDSIYFETNRAVIQHRSYSLLDQIAGVLSARPDIRRVSIEGHTDSRGTDRHNIDLSSRRAASVREYLLARGIAADRLTARGFGESVPIESNATEEGRSINRRVEFVITEQEGCRDEAGGAAPVTP